MAWLTSWRIAAKLFEIRSQEGLDSREAEVGQPRARIEELDDTLRNM
jgi:hypothetical protein